MKKVNFDRVGFLKKLSVFSSFLLIKNIELNLVLIW